MAVRTYAPPREHRVQTDVGTHIPIDRTGMQESTQRVQNFRLMRASPEELLVASVDDQLEPLGRTRQDSHRDRVGRKQAIGEWADQSTHRLVAFERGSHEGRDSHDPTLAQTMKPVFQPGASSISLPAKGWTAAAACRWAWGRVWGSSPRPGRSIRRRWRWERPPPAHCRRRPGRRG